MYLSKLSQSKSIEIPSDWEVKKFNDIAEINPETIDKKYKHNEILYVDIGSIDDYQITGYDSFLLNSRPSRAQRILKKNDVIISTVRPYLKGFTKIKHDKSNMICSTGFTVVRAKNREDSELIFQFIQGKSFETNIFRQMNGLAYPAVGSSVIDNSLIPYSLKSEERNKIGIILSNVDNLILQSEQTIKQIQKIKKRFSKNAFNGNITKKWRRENKIDSTGNEFLKNIKSKIKTEQEQNQTKINGVIKKKHSKIDVFEERPPNIEIPESWTWCRLADLMIYLTDYHANASYEILKEHVELKDQPDYAFMIRSTNFVKNNFDSLMKYITKDAYDFLWKSQLFGGEILIGKIGNAGSVYLMPNLDNPSSLAMNLFAIKISSEIDSRYVYNHLLSPFSKKNISQYVKGVSTQTIDKKSVKSLWIALPPKKEADMIVNCISNLNSLNDLFIGKKSKLEKYKKGLIQKLLTGQIRVKT